MIDDLVQQYCVRHLKTFSNCMFQILILYKWLFLRQIFGPKRDASREWKWLYNEELHSLYHSPNIARVFKSRRLRWVDHVATMEKGRTTFKILTGKPTERGPLERPNRKWKDNIR